MITITNYDKIHRPSLFTNFNQMSISLGIYITSFSGHGCLPAIYRSMKNKNNYNMAIYISFSIMLIIYILCSLLGYLIYGEDVDIIITKNILIYPDGIISIILIWLVILKCYFSEPCYIFIMSDIIESKFYINKNAVKRILRSIIFIIIVITSYFAHEHLAFIEAITGSMCSIPISIIIPSMIYIKLNYYDISKLNILIYTFIIVGGIIVSIWSTTNNVINVINKNNF